MMTGIGIGAIYAVGRTNKISNNISGIGIGNINAVRRTKNPTI